ncbi:helix-turn-helix domain-containing protein [Microterricola viridarii]|uniref:DNA binding domain-containing protein, excisionase family n=1 Tax=Microterricola viridarii TaxID=412690 RepID=A0A1H1SYA8_9MICO|nr:helix-turn-helix domain-containing protein [Microterricola viridarii]SDS52960.1 DNA binding domain-containing protein, excisionase family [Microterricola viridarii]
MDELETAIRRIAREEIEAVMAERVPSLPARRTQELAPRTLLSVAYAAQLLGVGRDYVYARIASGELPTVELGDGKQKRRISVAALDEFIRARSFPG